MPRRSSTGSSCITLVSSIVMSPSDSVIRRLTSFIAVVLPPPDGPIRTQISPAGAPGQAAAPPRGGGGVEIPARRPTPPAIPLRDVVEDDLRRIGPQSH